MRFTKLGWVGQHVNTIMKPTDCPTTEDQPNPKEKVGFWKWHLEPLFPLTANIFFVGWDWFSVGKPTTRNLTEPKFSANTLFFVFCVLCVRRQGLSVQTWSLNGSIKGNIGELRTTLMQVTSVVRSDNRSVGEVVDRYFVVSVFLFPFSFFYPLADG